METRPSALCCRICVPLFIRIRTIRKSGYFASVLELRASSWMPYDSSIPEAGETIVSNRLKGLVLVVDDELSIRNSTSMLLKSAGYDVCTAENGFDALL